MLPHECAALLAHVAVAALVRRQMPLGRRLTAGLGSIASAIAVVAHAGIPYFEMGADGIRARGGLPVGPHVFRADALRRIVAGRDRSTHPRRSWRRSLEVRAATVIRPRRGAHRLLPLVPAGLALLLAAGHGDRSGHYWTLVVGAELGAFATLPYLQTWPPSWSASTIAGRVRRWRS